MSGAPVLDIEINRVVGIISEHWVTAGNVDQDLILQFLLALSLKSQRYHPFLEKKIQGSLKLPNF